MSPFYSVTSGHRALELPFDMSLKLGDGHADRPFGPGDLAKLKWRQSDDKNRIVERCNARPDFRS
jgi:hypothetical protein